MPNEPIEPRLLLIQECIDEATRCLAVLKSELQINSRIESANAREIEKLKRHVAKLQHGHIPEEAPSADIPIDRD